MKIRTCYRWVRAELGWDHWDTVIGLRADEPARVAKARQRAQSGKERFSAVTPLATAGVTKRDVMAFWAKQPFDLQLLNVNGTTPDGNCDDCFLKSLPTLLSRARRDPGSFAWWINWEREVQGFGNIKGPENARFRKDRPSYAKILDAAERQGDMIGDDDLIDCVCTD